MNTEGWRTNSYYKQIIDLPNVELLHPTIPSENLIEKCNLVITIRGTSSLEAIKFGKPSIRLHGNLPALLKRKVKNKKYNIHLSLSDDSPWAQATVIIIHK